MTKSPIAVRSSRVRERGYGGFELIKIGLANEAIIQWGINDQEFHVPGGTINMDW